MSTQPSTTTATPTNAPTAPLLQIEHLKVMFPVRSGTFGGVAGFGEFGVVRLRESPLLATFVIPYRRFPVLVA